MKWKSTENTQKNMNKLNEIIKKELNYQPKLVLKNIKTKNILNINNATNQHMK